MTESASLKASFDAPDTYRLGPSGDTQSMTTTQNVGCGLRPGSNGSPGTDTNSYDSIAGSVRNGHRYQAWFSTEHCGFRGKTVTIHLERAGEFGRQGGNHLGTDIGAVSCYYCGASNEHGASGYQWALFDEKRKPAGQGVSRTYNKWTSDGALEVGVGLGIFSFTLTLNDSPATAAGSIEPFLLQEAILMTTPRVGHPKAFPFTQFQHFLGGGTF